ncbi:MAG TPA: glycosyltransferase family 39 protein [Bacteroidia bacterium]|nr:glycosyltransferase family 39 protein [Bacteroidia bacterium]
MLNAIKKLWDEKPLRLVLVIALFLRLIAAVFSKGYGWQDDHYLVIEAAQSWVDGTDYNKWLPAEGVTTPSGHSFFYPGVHFVLFFLLKQTGITDPQIKMYIVRFVHALFSMLIVFLGYKISERLSNKKTAAYTSLLLAVYWFMPFLSVRNLVEFVCIPFLMLGVWTIMKAEENKKPMLQFLLAGIWFGLALNTRYQSALFIGGVGLALLIQKKFIPAFVIGASVACMFALIQLPVDYALWNRPFAEFGEYVKYNIESAGDYLSQPWYFYLVMAAGLLIPPVSIFLMLGSFYQWRKQLLIFLPVIIFFVFHSYFENKQERFILTVVPFIIILGSTGINNYFVAHERWQKLYRHPFPRIFFWSLNLILLIPVTFTYSKRAKVESMSYLSHHEHKNSFIIEDSNHNSDYVMMSHFYNRDWNSYYQINESTDRKKFIEGFSKEKIPEFVVFIEEKNLEKRVSDLKQIIPALKQEAVIEPSFMDKLLHWLNPRNANQTIYIYRTK